MTPSISDSTLKNTSKKLKKPQLAKREMKHLREMIAERGLEIKAGKTFISPQPIKTKDELKK